MFCRHFREIQTCTYVAPSAVQLILCDSPPEKSSLMSNVYQMLNIFQVDSVVSERKVLGSVLEYFSISVFVN